MAITEVCARFGHSGNMLNANETIESLLPAIERTVAKIMGRTHAADVGDVVNDTVIALLSGGLERHEGRASLRAYAMTSAQNKALHFLKRHRNHGHASISHTDCQAGEDDNPGQVLTGQDGRHTVERAEMAAGLTFAVEVLLEGEEATFMQALLAGESNEAAAKAAGWSPAKGTRQRKALTAYIKRYLTTGEWE